MTPPEHQPEARTAGAAFRLFALLLILIAGTAVFFPALDFDFVNWDDPSQILNNPLVRDLSPAGLTRIFTSRVVRQYHPLVTLSFALEYRLFRDNPIPYHLHNLFLHLLNGGLLFALAYRLSGRRLLPAFLAGLFFTVHPLQSGAVVWISGRKDLLSAAFFLSSLLAYQKHLEEKSRGPLILSLVLGGLALLAKATTAVLPLVLLLADWRAGRKLSPRLLLEKLPLFLAAGVIAALSLFWQLAPEAGIRGHYGWEFGNILRAGKTIFFYLKAALFPLSLSPLYPAAAGLPAGSGPLAGAILLALVPLAFFTDIFRGEGGRTRLFGALFFLLCLLPVSRLVPFGGTEEVALRFMYLPLAGLALFAGGGLDAWFPRERFRTATIVAALAAAVFFGGLTRQVIGFWRDGEAFWSGVIEGYPEFDLAHHQLGSYYFSRRDYPAAITRTERAIELNPEIAYSYVIKGLAHRELGETGEARQSLSDARRILEEMGRTAEALRVSAYLREMPDSDTPDDE
ncbi:MAG: hypothetical protein P9M08_00520 [Candidatus Erginobacter occultus]|nr:hypothetical protein [Candidatus Erginobacter occultus]